MEKNETHGGSSERDVRIIFDQTLGRHVERLLGTGYGIGGLAMNLCSISSIVLLSEQARNEMNNLSTPEERYTLESLLTELAEMGLKQDENLDRTLQDMVQKGYIHIDDVRLIADKPAITMSRLLDRLFPKMPGLTLVAYFVQTMDEVLSGRKGLETAISQFDQALNLQGVPFKKAPDQPVQGKEAGTKPDSTQIWIQQSVQRDRPATSTVIKSAPPPPPSEPRILTSSQYSGRFEVREVALKSVSPSPDFAPESPAEEESIIKPQESEASGLPFTSPSESTKDLAGPTVAVPDEPLVEASPEPALEEEDDAGAEQETVVMESPVPEKSQGQPAHIEQPFPEEERKGETEPLLEEDADAFNEDSIERRIAEFEETLSMECPLCRISKIQVEKTGKGKVYYRCTNKECHFISWGKPHHLPCPHCSNPFLVEAPGKEGRTLLKCPRATCQYWQKLPSDPAETLQQKPPLSTNPIGSAASASEKPRRRVVRRRVVRRKR